MYVIHFEVFFVNSQKHSFATQSFFLNVLFVKSVEFVACDI